MSLIPSRLAISLFFALCTALNSAVAQASTPKVVVSIKPVELIARAVMEGVGTPSLLLDAKTSPHTATLKPSQAKLLQEADIVFRIGGDLEGFLDRPFAALSSDSVRVSLIENKNIQFPGEQAKEDDDHSEDEHDHDDGHGHHGGRDAHIWLDPQNAVVMAKDIAAALTKIDVANGERYQANASAFAARISELNQRLKAQLAPFSETRFLTQHDAYQHFENRFGLKGSRAVSISDQVRPGAATVKILQNYIAKHAVRCVFIEPQNAPKLMQLIAAQPAVKTETLYPLGSNLADGSGTYENLIEALAATLTNCLRRR